MSKYLKSITALVTGWIGWGAVVVASAPAAITASEWLGLAVATATALGVYAIPNGTTLSGKNVAFASPGNAPNADGDPAVWVVPDAAHQHAATLTAPAKKTTRTTKASR